MRNKKESSLPILPFTNEPETVKKLEDALVSELLSSDQHKITFSPILNAYLNSGIKAWEDNFYETNLLKGLTKGNIVIFDLAVYLHQFSDTVEQHYGTRLYSVSEESIMNFEAIAFNDKLVLLVCFNVRLYC